MKGIRIAAIAASVTAALAFGQAAQAKGPVPGKPGDDNIVQIAKAVNSGPSGEFSYLLAAVGCLTDDEGNNPVVDLLSGSDKYTLFAPTDEAFMYLQVALGISDDDSDLPSPEKTCEVDGILGEGTLFTVLAYHVTEGRRFSNSVFNRNSTKMVEMLTGDYIVSNPKLTLNDGAGQEVAVVPPLININASNGVIHVIDTVLLPFAP
jgi:transforming growth factor-beta-induced protein